VNLRRNNIQIKGAGHVIQATGYSLAGFRVLMREEAARLEVVMLLVALVSFYIAGVAWLHYFILAAIFFVLLCVEAINTAIELIVDRTSPEISEYGKQTKDLGSFAVFCMLAVFSIYSLLVVFAPT